MQAQRQLFERVLDDPDATPGHLRIAMALSSLVSSYSRLTERVSRAEIAEQAKVSEKTVTRTLAAWHDRGWIVWQPSTTRGQVSSVTVAASEPRDMQGVPTNEPEPDEPRDISGPSEDEPRDTQDVPLPERKPSGQKAAAPVEPDEDPHEGMADAIIAHALLRAGCSWETWFTYPERERDQLEAAVDLRLRDGDSPEAVFAVLEERARGTVRHWPRLLASRLRREERHLRAVG
jgi:hypothetical protein